MTEIHNLYTHRTWIRIIKGLISITFFKVCAFYFSQQSEYTRVERQRTDLTAHFCSEFSSAFSSLLDFLAIPWERGLHFILLIHPPLYWFHRTKRQRVCAQQTSAPIIWTHPSLFFFFLTFLPLCLNISTSAELPSRKHKHTQRSAKPGHQRNEENTIKSRILFFKSLEGEIMWGFFSSYFESYYNFFLYYFCGTPYPF